MLYYMTVLESLVSIQWLVNAIVFDKFGSIKEKCGGCFIDSLLSIFIQNFNWVFFMCTLHNLLCFLDPMKEQNFQKRLKWYILIATGVSGLYTYTVFLSGIYGVSVRRYPYL
jgi:hypothetical protein